MPQDNTFMRIEKLIHEQMEEAVLSGDRTTFEVVKKIWCKAYGMITNQSMLYSECISWEDAKENVENNLSPLGNDLD
jgi:hypothetical protein